MGKPTAWSGLEEPYRNAVREVVLEVATVSAAVSALASPTSAFRAYLATTASFTTTGMHQVIFNGLEYDVNGEYNITTGIWTATNSGLYLISAAVAYNTNQADQSTIEMDLFCNGSRRRYFHFDKNSGSFSPQYNAADVVLVTAGEAYQIQTSTPNASVGTPTTLLASSTATWYSATQLR